MNLPHGAPPQAIDERSNCAALRTIATIEAVKGTAILLVGLGVLTLLHKDVGLEAQHVLAHLHINPDRRLAQAFLSQAARTNDARLWTLASAGMAYSVIRFTEAWGLWNRRVWAEWFALLSGALYLPWEIMKISEHPSWLHFLLFFGNLSILLYMLYIRVAALKPSRQAAELTVRYE